MHKKRAPGKGVSSNATSCKAPFIYKDVKKRVKAKDFNSHPTRPSGLSYNHTSEVQSFDTVSTSMIIWKVMRGGC